MTSPAPRRLGTVLVGAAVVLIALNLRPGASSFGPVLAEVRGGLGMGAGVAGLVTGLPGLCFGVVGLLAVGLARRVGTSAGIALGAVALVVGLLGRVATDSVGAFVLLSVLALSGMAVGNVLVPAWIKQHGEEREVALATAYGSTLVLGGALGALVTAPILEATDDWHRALGVWGVLALLALPPWALVWARAARSEPRLAPAASGDARMRVAASPTAVAMTVMFGIQAMHAYIQFGWLPQIYRDAGLSASYAGALSALLTAVGVLGGLMMPTVIARTTHLRTVMWALGGTLALGYVGLLLAPATVPWLWALLLGVAGFAFPTAIALITARTRDPAVTAGLSGFVQPVGYLLAGIGPIAVGLVHDATGDWRLVLFLLAASAVPFTWACLRASRPVLVDDELGLP